MTQPFSLILSYQKMLGQLQDAGNTTTLAHYLELLAGAGIEPQVPSVEHGLDDGAIATFPQGIPLKEFLSTPISHWVE
jgi:hypothetical protein